MMNTKEQKREVTTEWLDTLKVYAQSNDTTPQAVHFMTQYIGMLIDDNCLGENRTQVLEYLYKLFYYLDGFTPEQLVDKGYPQQSLSVIARLHNVTLYGVMVDYITASKEEITERAKDSGNTNILSIVQAMMSTAFKRVSLEFSFIEAGTNLDRTVSNYLDSLKEDLDIFIDETFFDGLESKLDDAVSGYSANRFSIPATINGKECYLYPSSYYTNAALVEYEDSRLKKLSLVELKMHLLHGTMRIDEW